MPQEQQKQQVGGILAWTSVDWLLLSLFFLSFIYIGAYLRRKISKLSSDHLEQLDKKVEERKKMRAFTVDGEYFPAQINAEAVTKSLRKFCSSLMIPPKRLLALAFPPTTSTYTELKNCKGAGGAELYVSADGIVFDMSSARQFYGPGTSYSIFAGVDATYGLACMNLDPETWKAPGTYKLDATQQNTLKDWVNKFLGKYGVKGYLVGHGAYGSLDALNKRLAEEKSKEE